MILCVGVKYCILLTKLPHCLKLPLLAHSSCHITEIALYSGVKGVFTVFLRNIQSDKRFPESLLFRYLDVGIAK